jgi:hypothetical protein
MSWLDDVNAERIYRYRSPEGEVAGTPRELKEFFGVEEMKLEHGEKFGEYEYSGFDSISLKQRHEVTYDHNGRVGVRIKDEAELHEDWPY